MAVLLHLETSTKNCSVAISKDGVMLCLCEDFDENYSHAENLHKFIQWALEGAALTINDIDAVCVDKGPGSYTGLRIGVSAAKGLCVALDIPLLAIESLVILHESQKHKNFDFYIPMLDARRMEIYTTIFDQNGQKIIPTEAHILTEDSFVNYKKNKVLLLGDGAAKSKEILPLENFEIAENIYPSAQFMIEKGTKLYQEKAFEDVAYFEPFYLKDFLITQPKTK